jgi:hypothetical protein
MGGTAALKRQKLIDYSRGHVTILDRKALEQHSCECYAINKFDFNRLLGRAPLSGRSASRTTH